MRLLRFYPQDATYKPSNGAMLGLAGEPAILFLTRVDDGPVGLYFAGYTPDALKRATDLTVAAARAEAARQAQIVASWRADTTLPHFAEVRALIASLGQVNGDQQQRVFDRLEALGEVAVPAIIAQMDDRRPLRTQAISLVNHAQDAFEGMRHYGPEQVVDGLDAVLNQVTGESFGSIVNGGSTRQRDAVVAGWKVFAADLACKQGK
ncbi:RDD domain-containing protein [Novosphingobium sp. Rr 2-17]|nr:RDD domain-containing protein [Novosphingobium sp. Rr 2-17]